MNRIGVPRIPAMRQIQPNSHYVKYTSVVKQPGHEQSGLVLSPLVVNKIYTSENTTPTVHNSVRPPKKNDKDIRKPRMHETVSHKKDMKGEFPSEAGLNEYFKLKCGYKAAMAPGDQTDLRGYYT